MWRNYNNIYNDKSFTLVPRDIRENYIDISVDSYFIPIYDGRGKKTNIILVCRPFEKDEHYKMFLANRHDHIFLGISSYQEFPNAPENPIDNWKTLTKPTGNQYFYDMYKTMFDGWLHCFRHPEQFFDTTKPHLLISESDFVDYNVHTPDPTIKKEYDFIYVCTRSDWSNKNPDESTCNDWTSINKNWELAKKCLPILCGSKESGGFNLKGLLVGRQGCELPPGIEQNVTLTLHKPYWELMKTFQKAKFIFIPNKHDASPRIITEAMCYNLSVLINTNIVGGWKYATPQTGMLFNDENDIGESLSVLLQNLDKYIPRQHIINNYGPHHSSEKLLKFLKAHYSHRIKDIDNLKSIHHPRWKPSK